MTSISPTAVAAAPVPDPDFGGWKAPRIPPPGSAAPESRPATPGQLPPLHLRTPEQLREGMVVEVRGAGSEDIAVARLIQDGAQFMARRAGTTMGLKTVEVNYKAADRQGALGLATFQGNDGWFALSTRSTQGLLDGVRRLRERPFEQWSEAERQAFVQGNETILHEAAHVTLPAYDSANVRAWRGASRAIEEGISEVATMTNLGAFMREEFGIELPPLTDRITQSTSAYTRYSERIERLLGMGTPDGSLAELAAAASQVGDNVRADLRQRALAERIGANLGGPTAPAAIVDEIARTVDGFVAEENGTRTKLMQLQAALVDHRAGLPVDPDAVVDAARELDRAGSQGTQPEPVGDGPIE